jgi:hypothetical protein
MNENDKSRILAFLQSIDNKNYTIKQLKNIDEVRKKVKEDTKSKTEEEGMAILGFLLKKGYISIDDSEGIVLTKDSELNEVLKEMLKNANLTEVVQK